MRLTLDAQSGELCAGVVGGEPTAAVSDSFWRETRFKLQVRTLAVFRRPNTDNVTAMTSLKRENSDSLI